MTTPEATIRLSVDPTNPSQFFACCGLLELANRLWPGGAEGWFDGGEFRMAPVEEAARAEATPTGLIDRLARCRVTNSMSVAEVERLAELSAMGAKAVRKDESLAAEKKALESLRRESPIRLRAPFELTIDWFLDDRAGGSRFKAWAGQQSVVNVAESMHRPLLAGRWADLPPNEWFTRTEAGTGLPFYFDSGLSGQGAARDAGFGFDPLGFQIPARPLLELAAFVGFQRFRPMPVEKKNLYRYELWPIPLPPAAASAAACGAASTAAAPRYEFPPLYRTDYLKSFLPAQPCPRPFGNDDR